MSTERYKGKQNLKTTTEPTTQCCEGGEGKFLWKEAYNQFWEKPTSKPILSCGKS